MLFSLQTYLLLASSSAVVSALVPTPSPKPPVKPSDVLYYDNGQCGGVGYKGKPDCKANFNPETPFDNYFCVVVTKDYWTCSLDTFYSACPIPAKGPKKGEICALNGEGPNCCANYPNEQCILLNDDALTSRCFEVKNPPPPPGTSATPTPTPICRPNWAQCGGIGWTGTTCCANDPQWTCFRQNDWNSQCIPNTSLPSVTSTTSSTSRVSTKTSTSATPTPTTCQETGKLCGAPDWTGPTCCQNAPNVACIPYYRGLSYCFELSRCTSHWGQCGGLNFLGPFCCLDEPNWFCEYENPYFSNCHPRPNVTITTT